MLEASELASRWFPSLARGSTTGEQAVWHERANAAFNSIPDSALPFPRYWFGAVESTRSEPIPADLFAAIGGSPVSLSTEQVILKGNIDPVLPLGERRYLPIEVYGFEGKPAPIVVSLLMVSKDDESIEVETTVHDFSSNAFTSGIPTPQGWLDSQLAGPFDLRFGTNGKITSTSTFAVTLAQGLLQPRDTPLTFEIDLAPVTALARVNERSSIAMDSQDGLPPGEFHYIDITPRSELFAIFNNGLRVPLGRIDVSQFTDLTQFYAWREWDSSLTYIPPLMPYETWEDTYLRLHKQRLAPRETDLATAPPVNSVEPIAAPLPAVQFVDATQTGPRVTSTWLSSLDPLDDFSFADEAPIL
jgi:hypothetical protein